MTHADRSPEDAPDEFMTPLAVVAAVAHETYEAFIAAGFKPKQALYLVGQYARGASHAR